MVEHPDILELVDAKHITLKLVIISYYHKISGVIVIITGLVETLSFQDCGRLFYCVRSCDEFYNPRIVKSHWDRSKSGRDSVIPKFRGMCKIVIMPELVGNSPFPNPVMKGFLLILG